MKKEGIEKLGYSGRTKVILGVVIAGAIAVVMLAGGAQG
jgi:hypothetical protein